MPAACVRAEDSSKPGAGTTTTRPRRGISRKRVLLPLLSRRPALSARTSCLVLSLFLGLGNRFIDHELGLGFGLSRPRFRGRGDPRGSFIPDDRFGRRAVCCHSIVCGDRRLHQPVNTEGEGQIGSHEHADDRHEAIVPTPSKNSHKAIQTQGYPPMPPSPISRDGAKTGSIGRIEHRNPRQI
jgi:hypothetical protein